MKIVLCLLLGVLLAAAPARSRTASADPIVPVVEGEWWQVAANPDLGKYTSQKQEPVDFGLWQAADGTWQLWSCIRNTEYPGHTRLFHGWEGKFITDKNWTPKGIVMESDPKLGEPLGGLQAPHVVRFQGKFWMAYGDWTNICFATSDDGKTFTRVIQPDGKTGAFSEGPHANTRDPMMIDIGGVWHCYYTAIVGDKGYGYCRTSADLRTWSPSMVISYGGSVGAGPWWNECPHVVEVRPGEFVYFRNQFYGEGARNWVYYSTNPYNFGVDNDACLVADLPIAAPEIVQTDGKYYIAALMPKLDGIRIARLRWARQPRFGKPVFDFDNAGERAKWKMTEGNLDFVFTDKTHAPFAAPTQWVIGTCERKEGGYDDTSTGTIQSPPFMLDDDTYALLVGGGSDSKTVYVAVVDADSGNEIARFAGSNRNEVDSITFHSGENKGKSVRVLVVDKATGGWGHVNFGGVFHKGKPVFID